MPTERNKAITIFTQFQHGSNDKLCYILCCGRVLLVYCLQFGVARTYLRNFEAESLHIIPLIPEEFCEGELCSIFKFWIKCLDLNFDVVEPFRDLCCIRYVDGDFLWVPA